MEFITTKQLKHLPAMNEYWPLSRPDCNPTREDFEKAYLEICKKKGSKWVNLVTKRFERENNARKAKQRQQYAARKMKMLISLEIEKIEFNKTIKKDVKIKFQVNKDSNDQFGIVKEIHGFKDLTLDVVKCRVSKKYKYEDGTPKSNGLWDIIEHKDVRFKKIYDLVNI